VHTEFSNAAVPTDPTVKHACKPDDTSNACTLHDSADAALTSSDLNDWMDTNYFVYNSAGNWKECQCVKDNIGSCIPKGDEYW
jgi:hypothetical protein